MHIIGAETGGMCMSIEVTFITMEIGTLGHFTSIMLSEHYFIKLVSEVAIWCFIRIHQN